MSDRNYARRTEIKLEFEGVDISNEIEKYFLSMTYTDNEEDKADDLQISLDDRDGIWIGDWLNTAAQSEPGESSSNITETAGAKGAMLHVLIIQKNWNSDGIDKALDCGVFEIDSVDGSGPPARVNLKGTSIPYTSTIRKQEKSKAWENVHLKDIGTEIASSSGMNFMFESEYNPFYERREQVQQSDIVFLKSLCKDAGIALKVTSKTIVMFDAAAYEARDTVRTIRRGDSDVKKYRFATNFNDTAYDKCRVVYTDSKSGETIKYTYTPRRPPGSGLTLEINEKVIDREDARQLAMKRLRQKNKKEFTADFTLVGDLDLVAGVTVDVEGYGAFDGKYIIETAAHRVSGGSTVSIKLRKVLEEY